ncbi:MAG: protein kinase [Pseudomonadota bacterium]
MASVLLRPGQRIDSYEVIRPLGQGGMGEVWLVRDLELGRKAALKLVLPGRLTRPGARERFLREARATARVAHPHVVAVFGAGTVDGAPYMAMEYLEGETLAERMGRVRFSIREALLLAWDVAAALAAAHAAGIVHRDLKPANVLLPADGRLRVVDFGLARELLEAPPEGEAPEGFPGAEGASQRWGTVPYMAPEQWRGGVLGPEVDCWALGVLLFELLAGERPFPGTGWEVAARACGPQPVPSLAERVTGLPEPLVALVAACLSRDPAGRPSAEELRRRLGALCRPGSRTAEGEATSPYRGLLPFGPRHAGLFFGRDQEIAAFLEALHRQALLPVLGPSGAGKSSFLLAGVLPALLERGGWAALTLRPGAWPFEALARCLVGDQPLESVGTAGAETLGPAPAGAAFARDLAAELLQSPPRLGALLRRRAAGQRVLLVVDQLEELFTLVPDPEVRQAFADALAAAADDVEGPVRIAFTLREDFLGHLAGHAGLSSALVRGVTALRSPGPQALEEILTLPLEERGYRFEDGLVREMVDSVAAEPAGLPMLQFAALRLWEERDRDARLLTRRAYEAMGGVPGALASHADGVLEGLAGEQLDLARALLLRLVHPDGTRDRLPRERLADELGPGVEPVMARLLEARLLTARRAGPDQGVVLEISHESLAVRWERLRRWREEARGDLVVLAQARAAADLWAQRGHRPVDLWRGETLDDALRWRRRVERELPSDVERFLQASSREADRARRRRRLLFTGALGAALLAALAAVVVALVIAGKEREARARLAQALLSDARSAHQRLDYVEARAKLRASLEARDSAGGRALLAQLDHDPRVFFARTPGVEYFAAWSPDGRSVAASGSDGPIRVMDTLTGAVRLIRESEQSFTLAWSPDGQRLAWGEITGRVVVWDTGGWERLWEQSAHETRVDQVAFSPDGRLLASFAGNRELRWFDAQTGEARGATPKQGYDPVAFGPGSDTLFVSGAPSVLLDLEGGQPLRSLRCPAGDDGAVLMDPSGRRLAGILRAGHVPVCDAEGALLAEIPTSGGDIGRAGNLAFSADGRVLGIEHGEQGLSLHDLEAGVQLARWSYAPFAWALRGDGQAVATADFDYSVQVWHATPRSRPPSPGHSDEIEGLAFSPDGRSLASTAWDGQVLLWDPDSGRSEPLGTHEDAARILAFSPDGALLATSSMDGTVLTWDVAERRLQARLEGHGQPTFGVAFAPDGRALASTGYDSTLRLWDPRSGEPLRPPLKVGAHPHNLAFLDDGRALVVSTATRPELVRVDLSDWTPSTFFTSDSTGLERLALSPDGRRLAVLGTDYVLYMVDAASGARLWRGPDGMAWQGDVTWLPGGEALAVGAWDGWLRSLSAADGAQLRAVGPFDGILPVALSPDGRWLAFAGTAGVVRIWDRQAQRLRWRAPLVLPGPLLLSHRGLQQLSEGGLEEPMEIASAAEPLARVLEAADATGRLGRVSVDGRRLVLQTWDQAVELWDLATGERLHREVVAGLQEALPTAEGCAALAEGRVRLWRCQGGACDGRELTAAGVTAIASGPEGGLLLALEAEVWAVSAEGAILRRWPGEPGISALALDGETLLLGFSDGSVEEWRLDEGGGLERLVFQDCPGAAVTLLQPGPMDTLVGGWANGELRIWGRQDGRSLLSDRLHGALVHLARDGGRLLAATDIGDAAVLDLSPFLEDRCQVLRRAWAQIPVVWEEGVQERPGGPGHACGRAP